MTEGVPAGRAAWAIPPGARTEWLRLAEVLAAAGSAPCEENDPEMWWPASKRAPDPVAIAGCEVCPARAECLAYAVAADEREGLWGGLSRVERVALPDAVAA
ncbi:WhiB family transcriptional regulator [Blastococcus saxobsidens]|uniref:Transcriptional regulator WhiB n=1 Tax=Blastococcus saxobsidens TaxID=138336 RepID=A0A4Q7Y6Y9_9ACTN|nr:transcription factor WhiB [Blastococcus saxobsidens]